MSLLIAPGQRADVLVKAGSAGHIPAPGDRQRPGLSLADRAAGPRSWSKASRLRCSCRLHLGGAPFATIADGEITNTRRLTLSTVEPEFPPAANYQEFDFLVCGTPSIPNRVDQRIKLGAVEEWTVDQRATTTTTSSTSTPIRFQVVAVNGAKLPEAERDWRDTVVVPRNGSVTFRSRFLDFTGRFVLHCHMMNHEELGMMQVVEVAA